MGRCKIRFIYKNGFRLSVCDTGSVRTPVSILILTTELCFDDMLCDYFYWPIITDTLKIKQVS